MKAVRKPKARAFTLAECVALASLYDEVSAHYGRNGCNQAQARHYAELAREWRRQGKEIER